MDDVTTHEQIEFWNNFDQRWVTYRSHFDRVGGPPGNIAIERAAFARGERVIDVGCGCGTTALDLAARV